MLLALVGLLFASLVAYAVHANYLLFADGGFFAFALSVDAPWELVWRQFPSRTGALALTQAVPWLLAHHGATSTVVSLVYQVNFLAIPLLAVGATWLLTRHPAWTAWSAFASVVLSFPLMGFPSEVYVAGALLTPIAAWIADGGTSKGRGLAAVLLAVTFIFSHEGAVLCLPMLLYSLHRQRSQDPARSGLLVAMALVLLMATASMLVVKLFVEPSNPHVAQAIAKNTKTVFQIATLKRPLADFSVIAVLFVILSWRLKRTATKNIVGIASALALAVVFGLALVFDAPRDRYDCRTVMVWLMPLLALLYTFRPAFTSDVLKATVVVFLGLAVVHAKSIHGWDQYQKVLAAHAPAQSGLSGDEWKRELQARHPGLVGYYWSWAAPYASIMAADAPQDVRLLMDRAGWYAPMTCAQVRHIQEGHGAFKGFGPVLKNDVCQKNE